MLTAASECHVNVLLIHLEMRAFACVKQHDVIVAECAVTIIGKCGEGEGSEFSRDLICMGVIGGWS